ncbi:MAG: hypothetical protein ACPHZB_07495, partial [Flavobacteriales bacterium]
MNPSPTDMASSRVERWLKTLGPGILFASTCIGVSHLVQSTRAGALAGALPTATWQAAAEARLC